MGEGVPGELVYRGSIPEELFRPRRDEAPRYPVDTVIGPLGQGRAPREAYEAAKSAAGALLQGSLNAPILSTVNSVFLEGCMSALNGISPRTFRLGGGREEPDGSVSFLVRFAGRDEGITGELFVRLEERRGAAAPAGGAAGKSAEEGDADTEEDGGQPEPEGTGARAEMTEADVDPEAEQGVQTVPAVSAVPAMPAVPPVERVWVFEDLILEAARSREEENRDSRHRYDFPPYERFF